MFIDLKKFIEETGLSDVHVTCCPKFYWNETLDKVYDGNKDAPGCTIRVVEATEFKTSDITHIKNVLPNDSHIVFVGDRNNIFYSIEEQGMTTSFRIAIIKKK